MPVVLEWLGDAASVMALDACLRRGHDVALRLPTEVPHGVPEFVLQEQAASLGLAVTKAPATAAATPNRRSHEELVAAGYRAVVVAVRAPLDASFLGRVLDAQALRDARAGGGEEAFATLVFDGPRFRRRVDLVALDAEPDPEVGGWRLPVGLRGC